MATVKNIAQSGGRFFIPLSTYDTRKTNQSTQQKHPETSSIDSTSERLKLVGTDLINPVTPTAIGGYADAATYTDHRSRLKDVYSFYENKSHTLHSLCKFIQDMVIAPSLRVQLLRSDDGSDYPFSS